MMVRFDQASNFQQYYPFALDVISSRVMFPYSITTSPTSFVSYGKIVWTFSGVLPCYIYFTIFRMDPGLKRVLIVNAPSSLIFLFLNLWRRLNTVLYRVSRRAFDWCIIVEIVCWYVHVYLQRDNR